MVDYQADRIDCLKIDTEGTEMEVLHEVRENHWLLTQPAVVESHNGKARKNETVELLHQQGFSTHVDSAHESLELFCMVYAIPPTP